MTITTTVPTVGQTFTTRTSGVTGTVAEVVPFQCKGGRIITRIRLTLADGATKWTTL